MVDLETHYYMITLITTITNDFHYYITAYYSITTIMHLPNLEMPSDCADSHCATQPDAPPGCACGAGWAALAPCQ